MPEKYLSIITNFGCHFTCPYCIVKNNHIDVPRTTIESLDKLKDAVKAEGATIISVSGGGDPLHNYSEHKDYYEKLFALCEEMNIPLEMHTSYLNMKDFPYEKCHRVVYHCRGINQLTGLYRRGNEIIRAVYVVDETFTDNNILAITASAIWNHIDELSFRQMVNDKYQATNYCQDLLRRGHKEGLWHYIEQGDYNTYFVEGKLYYKFSDIKGEKEND